MIKQEYQRLVDESYATYLATKDLSDTAWVDHKERIFQLNKKEGIPA